jgi:hypothetical protein
MGMMCTTLQIACACDTGVIFEDIRRSVWAEELNICIFPKIPGKGSVKQQPTDRAHGTWRAIIDFAEDHCIGPFAKCFRLRFV